MLLANLSGFITRVGAGLSRPQVGAPIPDLVVEPGGLINWTLPDDAFFHNETLTFTVDSTLNSSIAPVTVLGEFGSLLARSQVAISVQAFFVAQPWANVSSTGMVRAYSHSTSPTYLGEQGISNFGEFLVDPSQSRIFYGSLSTGTINASDPRSMNDGPFFLSNSNTALFYDAARGLLFTSGSDDSFKVYSAPTGLSLNRLLTTTLSGVEPDGSSALALVSRNFLLACRAIGTTVVNTTDPANVNEVSTFGNATVGVFARDHIVYTIDSGSAPVLHTWNLTTPTAPSLLASRSLTGPSNGGRLSGSVLFVLESGSVRLFETSVPTNLQPIHAEPVSNPLHIAVDGQTALISSENSRAEIWRLFQVTILDTASSTLGSHPVTIEACAGAGNCVNQTFWIIVETTTGTSGAASSGSTGGASTSGGTSGTSSSGSTSGANPSTTSVLTTAPANSKPGPASAGSSSGELSGGEAGIIAGLLAGLATLVVYIGGAFWYVRRRSADSDSLSMGTRSETRSPDEPQYGDVADVNSSAAGTPQYGDVADVGPQHVDAPQYGDLAEVNSHAATTPQYGGVADVAPDAI